MHFLSWDFVLQFTNAMIMSDMIMCDMIYVDSMWWDQKRLFLFTKDQMATMLPGTATRSTWDQGDSGSGSSVFIVDIVRVCFQFVQYLFSGITLLDPWEGYWVH